MGLLKPRLPTSQYVSSAPLPWEDTGRGGLRRAGARAGDPEVSVDRGDPGRARPAVPPARAQRGEGRRPHLQLRAAAHLRLEALV